MECVHRCTLHKTVFFGYRPRQTCRGKSDDGKGSAYRNTTRIRDVNEVRITNWIYNKHPERSRNSTEYRRKRLQTHCLNTDEKLRRRTFRHNYLLMNGARLVFLIQQVLIRVSLLGTGRVSYEQSIERWAFYSIRSFLFIQPPGTHNKKTTATNKQNLTNLYL